MSKKETQVKNLRDFTEVFCDLTILPDDKSNLVNVLMEFYKEARDNHWNWEEQNRHCAICNVPLSHEEVLKTTCNDFHHTCDEHRQFADRFLPENVRRDHNIEMKEETPDYYA